MIRGKIALSVLALALLAACSNGALAPQASQDFGASEPSGAQRRPGESGPNGPNEQNGGTLGKVIEIVGNEITVELAQMPEGRGGVRLRLSDEQKEQVEDILGFEIDLETFDLFSLLRPGADSKSAGQDQMELSDEQIRQLQEILGMQGEGRGEQNRQSSNASGGFPGNQQGGGFSGGGMPDGGFGFAGERQGGTRPSGGGERGGASFEVSLTGEQKTYVIPAGTPVTRMTSEEELDFTELAKGDLVRLEELEQDGETVVVSITIMG